MFEYEFMCFVCLLGEQFVVVGSGGVVARTSFFKCIKLQLENRCCIVQEKSSRCGD